MKISIMKIVKKSIEKYLALEAMAIFGFLANLI
jgi:hypothetical protein